MGIWKYFFMTLALELPIVIIWLKNEWKKALQILLLLNLFTWPLLLIAYGFAKWNIIVLECAVAVVEGVGYKLFFRRSWAGCMLIAFVVNSISYIAGFIISK